MFGPIRAVAVDDKPGHLLGITTGLTAIGIPCIGYWWDRAANELRPAPPASGLAFVRLIFMDLNLAEQSGVPDAQTLAGVVMTVLKQLVAPEGGPYLLVFWTQIATRVEDVSKIIYERIEAVENVPAPIAITELPKGPFIIKEPGEKGFEDALETFYATLHTNIEALKDGVRKAVEHDSTLCALSHWETRAAEAAARAVNQIHGCARSDGTGPLETIQSVQKVMAKVAVAAAGESAACDNPARALDAGMVDILVDQFGISVEDAGYQAAVTKSLGEVVKGEIAFQDEVAMAASLNTFFHIDRDIAAAKASDRGVVVSTRGISKGELGLKPSDHLDEFIVPYSIAAPERQPELKALTDAFRKSAEYVLIELGADCDHAQDTSRTRRYLLGAEVPTRYASLLTFPDSNKLRSEALQLLGPWTIEHQARWLLVSCRRFWTWQDRAPFAKLKVRYRLRASLVNKLLHHYAAFHSRPGIIEFQGQTAGRSILYFAYGSNMLTKRLRERVPSALVVGTGYVEGHRLAFHKVSTDGSGKCDLHQGDAGDRVHGVLFNIDINEKVALDKHEGLGSGYRFDPVNVVTSAGTCQACAYFATDTDQALAPYDWYVELVVAGATEHKLPEDYIEAIRAMTSQTDADDVRAAENRALLV